MTKTQDDVRALANALARFAFDVDRGPNGPLAGVRLLVGPGLAPGVGDEGDAAWVLQTGADAVASLDNHLLTNIAGHASRPPVGAIGRGWRGPYLGMPVGADGWGRRYGVNIGLVSDPGRAVLVLSAGRNGIIETPFTSAHPTAGGDDVVALVSTGGL